MARLPKSKGGISLKLRLVLAINWLIVLVLLGAVLQPFVLPVYANDGTSLTDQTSLLNQVTGSQFNTSYLPINNSNYVDPITLKAHEMNSQGISNDSIVKYFASQGIIYNPAEDSWYKGSDLSVADAKNIHFITNQYYENGQLVSEIYNGSTGKTEKQYTDLSPTKISSTSTDTLITPNTVPNGQQINSWLCAPDQVYNAIGGHVISGSMSLSSDGTSWEYVTTHVGINRLQSNEVWTEVGLMHKAGDNSNTVEVYTYDSQEDGVGGPHPKVYTTTSTTADNGYLIDVTSNYESGVQYPGYVYYTYWNGVQIRKAHLPSYYDFVDESKEVIPASGATHYTPDISPAIFYGETIYKYDSSGHTDYSYPWGSGIHTTNLLWQPDNLVFDLTTYPPSYFSKYQVVQN